MSQPGCRPIAAVHARARTTVYRASSGMSSIGTARRRLPRVSRTDRSCARRERDLTAFAERSGSEVVGTTKETGSGVRRASRSRQPTVSVVSRGVTEQFQPLKP